MCSLYLAIKHGFEPLLLGSDCIWYASGKYLPGHHAAALKIHQTVLADFCHYFYILDEWSILPSLIFMGVGAMTDFGPLIANPMSFLLGAAAQFGIYAAYFVCNLHGIQLIRQLQRSLSSVVLMARLPSSLQVSLDRLQFMGPIAVAAYSYMSLVPIIQPPIMKASHNREKSVRSRWSSFVRYPKLEKILFPIIVTIVVCLILPTTAPLVGMLMLGNLFRESGVVKQLTETASNALMYIVVILLGTSVGAIHKCRGIPECRYTEDRCSWSDRLRVRYRRRCHAW